MQRKRYGTRLVQFESLRKVKPANRHILFSTALQNAMYSGAIEPILSGKYRSAPGSQSRLPPSPGKIQQLLGVRFQGMERCI